MLAVAKVEKLPHFSLRIGEAQFAQDKRWAMQNLIAFTTEECFICVRSLGGSYC